MDVNITVEALPLLGVCNLCLGDGTVRSMLSLQRIDGREEIYAKMLLKCFNIDITKMDLGDNKQVICESCILKLRDCLRFRELAETSLKTMEEGETDHEFDNYDCKSSPELKLKAEPLDDDDDEFDCEDDEVIANIIKEVKKENCRHAVKKRREKSINITKDQCLNMFGRGLFKFRTYKDYYSCIICSNKFKCLDTLKDHINEHSEKYILLSYKKTARRCNFLLQNMNLRCKFCNLEVINFDQLKMHVTECRGRDLLNNELPFKLEKDQLDCKVCKKNFLNFVSLNKHMNMHYPNHICDDCGKAFASKARLRAHKRTHEVGDFPCKVCGMIFDKVTKRENHVSKEHKSGVRYGCKICKETFTSFYSRQKHLADRHNEDLRKYKCQACPQSYVTPGHLSSHVRRDHLNERNFKCDKCDLAFYTRNALQMHMVRHDGERIHVCPICQKSYQRKKTLREHMRIHNNDKRFVCPYCARAFTQKCTLKGHLKLHETKREFNDHDIQTPLHSI